MFKNLKLQWRMVILISITGIVVLDFSVAAYGFLFLNTVEERAEMYLFAEAQAVAHSIGVVAADVTPEHLDRIIDGVRIAETGYAFVVRGSDTQYVVHPFAKEAVQEGQTLFDVADEADNESVQALAEAIVAGNSDLIEVDNPRTGNKDWLVYIPIESTDWWLILTVPIAELVPGVRQLIILAAVISLVALVALAVLAFFVIAQSVVKPLETLADMAQAIAGGDLGVRTEVEFFGEMGVLADAFNQMVFQLRDMLRSEKEQREYSQAVVQEYSEYMTQVAQGNLAARLTFYDDEDINDPLTVLGRNLNETVSSLQRMIRQVREASNSLSSAASEILASAQDQALGSHQQSAAIAQTTTTVSELKTIAEQSVERAQEVANAGQRTVEVSHAGLQSVQETIASMNEIKMRVEGIAENILALSEQTQQIGDIISTVSEIATQSNILALNASVEAARAGEYGKGFAVVAVEVRNLAEQSRQATAQVKAILSDIQKATNATVMATEEGTKGVDVGVQSATQTGGVIEQLAGVIEGAAQASMQVVAGGRQQASGVEQVALAMQSINQSTVQGLDNTRQTEKAAQDLNDLARSLTEVVEQYRL